MNERKAFITIGGQVGTPLFSNSLEKAKESFDYEKIYFRNVTFDEATIAAILEFFDNEADSKKACWRTVSFMSCSKDPTLIFNYIATALKSITDIAIFGNWDQTETDPVQVASRAFISHSDCTWDTLSFRNTQISLEASRMFHQAIQVSAKHTIKNLHFIACSIEGEDEVQATTSDIEGGGGGSLSQHPMALALNQCIALKALTLQCAKMPDSRTSHIINGLIDSENTLHTLDVSNSVMRPNTLEALHSLLSSPSCSLKDLNLNCCVGSGDQRSVAPIDLSDIFQHISSLTKLCVSKTAVNKESIRILSFTLSNEGCYLEYLDLSYCGIGEECAETIAEAVAVNTSLKKVHLGGDNPIAHRGARALVQALKQNTNLVMFILPLRLQWMYCSQIIYHLNLNIAGRHLLQKSDKFPLGLWPFVLARCQRIISSQSQDGEHCYCRPDDLVYHFLTKCPTIAAR